MRVVLEREHLLDGSERGTSSAQYRGIKADPAAWAIAHAVGEIQRGVVESSVRTATGLLVVSATAAASTVELVRRQAADGRVSPRTFVAAGPGTLAGLASLLHGLRGPTLLLTSLGDGDGAGAAVPVHPRLRPTVHRWLASGCSRVVIAQHDVSAAGQHRVLTAVAVP